jgi:hypothetical protein
MIDVRGGYYFPDGPRGIGTGLSLLTVVYSATYNDVNLKREWWRDPIDTADAQGRQICSHCGLFVPARLVRWVGGKPYAPPFAPKYGPKED